MQALKFLRKHISELLVVLLASLLSFKKNGLFILLQNQTFFCGEKAVFVLFLDCVFSFTH